MSETAENIQAAKARLQAAPEPAKRTKNPVYAVFVRNETKAWVCMSEQLAAPNRQAAIVLACEDNNEPDREGEFLVLAADAVKYITRKIEQTTVETFV
jgi:hypothetical protein